MGTRGPLPKRESARAGHNAKSEKADVIHAATPVAPVEPPVEYDEWDPYIRGVYDSFTSDAPVTRLWEKSDWAMLALTCDGMNRNRNASRFSAELHKAHLATLDSLGATEGARRRSRIEIDRPSVTTKPEASGSGSAARLRALRGGKGA